MKQNAFFARSLLVIGVAALLSANSSATIPITADVGPSLEEIEAQRALGSKVGGFSGLKGLFVQVQNFSGQKAALEPYTAAIYVAIRIPNFQRMNTKLGLSEFYGNRRMISTKNLLWKDVGGFRDSVEGEDADQSLGTLFEQAQSSVTGVTTDNVVAELAVCIRRKNLGRFIGLLGKTMKCEIVDARETIQKLKDGVQVTVPLKNDDTGETGEVVLMQE